MTPTESIFTENPNRNFARGMTSVIFTLIIIFSVLFGIFKIVYYFGDEERMEAFKDNIPKFTRVLNKKGMKFESASKVGEHEGVVEYCTFNFTDKDGQKYSKVFVYVTSGRMKYLRHRVSTP